MIHVRVRERPDREHLQLAYTDPLTGKVKTKSAGTSKWKAAERAAAKWEAELLQRHGISAVGWEIFRTRFEDEHLITLADGSAKQYIYALDSFEKHIGKPRDINLINASVMSQFASKLRETGIASDSVGSKLRHVKSALGWAARIDMIIRAPIVTLPPRSGSRGRPLTFTEVIRFFQTIKDVVPDEHRPAIVALVKIMWLGGLRLSEALKLSYDSEPIKIDFEENPPCIHWGHGGQKAKRVESICLLPDFYRFLLSMPNRTGLVVKTKLSKRDIQNYLAEIGQTADIDVGKKYATAHDFRRTFGNRTALRVHTFVLKHLMRHRDIQTTMRYYVSLDNNEIGHQIWRDVHGHVHASEFRSLKPRGPNPVKTEVK